MRAEPSYGASLSPFLNSQALASLTFPVGGEVKQCWLWDGVTLRFCLPLPAADSHLHPNGKVNPLEEQK